MADGVERANWDRTATLWALSANLGRGKDSPTYNPKQIHPFYPDTIPDSSPVDGVRLTPELLDTWAQAMVANHAKQKRH